MIEINEWGQLPYSDPELVLRDLRRLECAIVDEPRDPKVRRLRTAGLKEQREARDAALFAFGMRHVVGTNVYVAPLGSDSEYDFIVKFVDGETFKFVPVQLKELVPEDLNSAATLDGLLKKLTGPRYQPSSETVLAIRLNRTFKFDPPECSKLYSPFSEIWLFGQVSFDGDRWAIWGDLKGDPQRFDFNYPK